MSKAMLLRESDMQGGSQGHFVSSFSACSEARGSFAAYKNSPSSSVYTNTRVSARNQSAKTLKSVAPKMVQKVKLSPQFSSSSTRFGHEVRKRVLVTLLVAASFLAVLIPASQAFGGLTLGSSKSSAAVAHSTKTITVVVKNGDTLWSIARILEPKKDPRETVDALVNARGTSNLMVGETIEWAK